MNTYHGFSEIIPLGSWCRTAFQARQLTKALAPNSKNIGTYPFDWAISPLISVTKIIRKQIDPNQILNEDQTRICPHGFILCGHSGIRFAHHLKIKELSNKFQFNPQPGEILPKEVFKSDEFINAKGRFLHTYVNLHNHLGKSRRLFVRYVELSPELTGNTAIYKEVYTNENPMILLESLKQAGVHPTSRLVYIFSKTIPGVRKIIGNTVQQVSPSNSIIFSCKLLERKGSNGNQEDTFFGDSQSWLDALREADSWFTSFNT